MSRLRWGLGAAITLLALAAAVRALAAYVDHRLWLGCASVLLLAVIAVAGFVSLGRARLRIERELGGLGAATPRGELIAGRRRRLEAVRTSGARLDLDALAASTASVERGQAYLGRYLVAVTVLVGLVGTFAGLMETLRAIAPLLRDDRLSTVQALALPLAGLDVTFGASVVGILVTLALALVQGDLVLAEEQALARLEELTAHVLVPSLWPAGEGPDERVAREVAALRGDLQRALATAGEATAERVAAVARVEVERLVTGTRESIDRALAAVAAAVHAAGAASDTQVAESGAATRAAVAALAQASERVTAALAQLGDGAAAALRTTSERAATTLAEAGAAATTALARSSESVAATLTKTGAAAVATMLQTSEAAAATLTQTGGSAVVALAEATQSAAATLTATADAATHAMASASGAAAAALTRASDGATAALADLATQAGASFAATTQQATEHFGAGAAQSLAAADAIAERAAALLADAHARAQEATAAGARAAEEQLTGAAGALGAAAVELRDSAATLATTMSTLGPELEALTREVALLAARSDAAADLAVSDELVRLGDGLERLEQLLERERGRRERA